MGLSSFGMGFTVGFGTGFLSRELLPTLKTVAKPLLMVSLKSSIRLYEQSREAMAHFGEMLEDSVAEVKYELKRSHQKELKRSKKKSKKPSHTKQAQEKESEILGAA